MSLKQTRRSISVRGKTYELLAAYGKANSVSMSNVVEQALDPILAEFARTLPPPPLEVTRPAPPITPVRPRPAPTAAPAPTPAPRVPSRAASVLAERRVAALSPTPTTTAAPAPIRSAPPAPRVVVPVRPSPAERAPLVPAPPVERAHPGQLLGVVAPPAIVPPVPRTTFAEGDPSKPTRPAVNLRGAEVMF